MPPFYVSLFLAPVEHFDLALEASASRASNCSFARNICDCDRQVPEWRVILFPVRPNFVLRTRQGRTGYVFDADAPCGLSDIIVGCIRAKLAKQIGRAHV